VTEKDRAKLKHQPGREPVPPEAWSDLTAALRAWGDALAARWKDPSFRPFRSSTARGRLTFTTTASGGAAVTPAFGNPIRGADGVSIRTEHEKEPEKAQLSDALLEWPLRIFGGVDPPSAEAVWQARKQVQGVFEKFPELRRATMRVSWGPSAAEGSDEREKNGTSKDAGTCVSAVSHLLEHVLTKAGVRVEALPSTPIADDWIRGTIDRLRRSIEAKSYPRQLIALLNCPAIDTSEPVRIWEGTWHDSACWIEMGYPTDALCSDVLSDLGYEYVQVGSNLDHINCLVRFTYAIAADISSEDWADANWSAELYLREAVDLVRVGFEGDVGILHFNGKSAGEDESLLLPHFLGGVQEGRSHLPRTPLRRVYDPPPARALGRDQLTMIGQMFERYAIERIKVPGLPVAMDRLRAVFERYEPGEPGRLVDAVTGLEALFLSGGMTQELNYRLQIRIARFLEADLEKRVSLAKRFSKLYKLRSKVVHTGTQGSAKEAEAQELQSFGVELLRRALVVFILSDFAVGKDATEMEETWLEFMLKDGQVPAAPEGL
jgi:hypothetical protein